MKKLSTMLLTAAMVSSVSTGVYASPLNISQGQLPGNVKVIVQTKGGNQTPDLENLCKELGLNNNCYQQSDCPILNLPGIILPGGSENNKPDNTLPGLPDFELPDVDKPETDKPDIENPDQNRPGDNNQGTTDSAFASEVVRLVNVERTKAGLSPLSTDSAITAAAQVRAEEQKQSFSHTRPNGKHFSTALTENDVNYSGAGENIAMGQKTPQQVMEAWMNSDGHRANILNKNFTKIGVGYMGSGSSYWAQLFTY